MRAHQPVESIHAGFLTMLMDSESYWSVWKYWSLRVFFYRFPCQQLPILLGLVVHVRVPDLLPLALLVDSRFLGKTAVARQRFTTCWKHLIAIKMWTPMHTCNLQTGCYTDGGMPKTGWAVMVAAKLLAVEQSQNYQHVAGENKLQCWYLLMMWDTPMLLLICCLVWGPGWWE